MNEQNTPNEPPVDGNPANADAEARHAAADPGESATADVPKAESTPSIPAPDPVQIELEATRGRLREVESRLREVSKAYRELEADMDAFRKRSQALADQRAERKGHEAIEQFFEPVRNLRRSLAAAGSDPGSLLEGITMISAQFDESLRRLGVAEVPGVGAPFDPAVHDALAIQPVTDAAQDNKVLFVHAAGYRVGNKTLQPAQVVIGKYGEPTPEA